MNNKKLVPEVINMEKQFQDEFNERIFARVCQLIDSRKGELKIEEEIFDTFYDEVEEELNSLEVVPVSNKREGDYIPNFLDDEGFSKLKILRVIERALGEETTVMSDIVGAVINPTLCFNKSISIIEDEHKKLVIFKIIQK